MSATSFFGGAFFGGEFFNASGTTPPAPNPIRDGGGGTAGTGGWHAALSARRKRQEREESDVQIILQAIMPHIAAQAGTAVTIELENDDD